MGVANDGSGSNAAGVLSVTLGYRGAAFRGFARQPGQFTVQGDLEAALRLLFKREVETVCAGRTDAGVHARAQVVSFEVSGEELAGRTERSLLRSLDALTHDDIAVRAVERRPLGFSARFDAIAREYRYFFVPGAEAPLFLRDFCWHVPKGLDVDAMREGARHLIGEHDFKSFCLAVSAEGKPTYRNIMELELFPETVLGEDALVMRIVGNAFLHSMVRTIAGTLALVGRGLREPDWVAEVLEARDRRAAGENAPAQGLVFWRVVYP